MRSAAAIALLSALAGQSVASPLPQSFDLSLLGPLAAAGDAAKGGAGDMSKFGDLLGSLLNGNYGRVPDPPGAAPRRITQEPRWTKQAPGSKTVKIRYGPYNIPNMMHKNGVGEGGSLWNYPDKQIEKPCEKCVIIGMNAGLEYPDGRTANINEGLWLHHFVLFNIGPGREDLTCKHNPQSLPHINVGSTSLKSERLFSSGNERTPAWLTEWSSGGKVGYHLNPEDKFAFIVDLMNMNEKDATTYLTITYDYVEDHPEDYDDMRPVWFDVEQCGTSEAKPKAEKGAYQLKAPLWTADIEGEILGAAGHLHDGGMAVLLEADGKQACNSSATYGGTPAYIASAPPMDSPNSATVHISKMSQCVGDALPITQMKKGQVWELKADYDYDQHKGMLHEDGHQEDVMGIAIMYVRQPKNKAA